VYELSAEGGLRQWYRDWDEPTSVPARGVMTGQSWVALQSALSSDVPWLETLRVCAHLSTEDRSALQAQLRALLHHHCGVTTLRTRQLMVELQSL
jgi:DNA repair protein RecO (recombination protein O)